MAEEQQQSIIQGVVQLIRAFFSFIREIAELAALELQLAGKSVVRILLLCIFMLFLAIFAWFFLLAALAAWIVTFQISWPLALLIVAGCNFAVVIPLFVCVLRLRRNLTFPETRKQLQAGVKHEKTFDEMA